MLPMGFGYAEGVTHDYKRHGTTTLFSALNVLNGAVLAACKPRHRHQEFNRAENSHQPTRERERRMRGFRDRQRTQTFLSSFGPILRASRRGANSPKSPGIHLLPELRRVTFAHMFSYASA
jgi:transposase